jgi:hypothetical protein
MLNPKNGHEAQSMVNKLLNSANILPKSTELMFIFAMRAEIDRLRKTGWQLLETHESSAANLAGADFIWKNARRWWPIDVTLDLSRKQRWSRVRMSFCVRLELGECRMLSVESKEEMLRSLLAYAAVEEARSGSITKKIAVGDHGNTIEIRVKPSGNGMSTVTFIYGGDQFVHEVFGGIPNSVKHPSTTQHDIDMVLVAELEGTQRSLNELAGSDQIWSGAGDYAHDLSAAIKYCRQAVFNQQVVDAMHTAMAHFINNMDHEHSEGQHHSFSNSAGGTIVCKLNNLRLEGVVETLETIYVQHCEKARKTAHPLKPGQGKNLINSVLSLLDAQVAL